MDNDKKTELEELMEETRSLKDELETRKAQLDEQERALNAREIKKPETGELKMSEWRNIADAMIEKRALALGADNANKIGRVALINEIFKEMVAKKPLLGRVRKFVGPNAQTNIPVLNPTIATPAGQAEGAKGVGESEATIAAKTMTPYAYISVLPVTAEALQFGAIDVENEVPEIFAEAFADAAHKGMVTEDGSGQKMTGIFAKAMGATEIQCAAAGLPTMKDLVDLALQVKDKSDSCVIVMNTKVYSNITAGKANDEYKVYKEELIRTKRVEGVEVILTNYAPSVTPTTGEVAAVALDLHNYAYGVAADLTIEPLKKVGDVNTYFQATMWMNGMPIVNKDVYQLVIKG